MRFGIIKTLVENKLVESFKNDALKTDMYLFNKKLLKNKDFVKMMSIYDNLNENKGLDKETSNYLVEDMVSEFKNLNLSESTNKFIKSWTKDIVLENKYETIDDLLYGDLIKPEKKSIAKKKIVESLTKTKPIVENKTPKVPISSMLKVANKTAEKYLENLTESERNSIKEILTSKEENLKSKFDELKENAVQKIDILISESDEELKNVLVETKERVTNSKPSKKEYIKLLSLTQNL
jgi:succinate dehydrogenase flavin-adding protein (antitoxin of CptAB toxin-antitoxin module)